MENVVLIIHLILAICLIAVVLLQRSEGGALGIGGGGGGMVSARGAATALSKVTWGLALGFIATSITLTILAGGGEGTSVIESLPSDGGGLPLPDLPPAAEDGGGFSLPDLPNLGGDDAPAPGQVTPDTAD